MTDSVSLARQFRHVRVLGVGGMGVVHEVVDILQSKRLALKTLRAGRSSRTVRHLKDEFRVLAEISHPHLVKMHELYITPTDCFFTMDLLRGIQLLGYVQGEVVPSEDASPDLARFASLEARTRPLEEALDETPPSWSSPRVGSGATTAFEWNREVEGRVRQCFAQLSEGVAAIHGYGLLHRDLKPSNILVSGSGHLVVLDFGIAQDTDNPVSSESSPGTPAYLSPEQASGRPAVTASDWYAVGAMLHEALFGYGPFCEADGRLLLRRKRAEEIVLPAIATERPSDLCQLCQDLLRKDWEKRPQEEEVLRRLGVDRRSAVLSTVPPGSHVRFVGRRSELVALDVAMKQSRDRLTVVEMVGEPGVGKSALAAYFLRDVSFRGAKVFKARCHERENIPFKAFDGIADGVRRYLDAEEPDFALPGDWELLSGIFPALLSHDHDWNDLCHPEVLAGFRKRAFRAFARFFERLSEASPVVLYVDDAQWADRDSQAVLREIFAVSPPLLLLISRRAGVATGPFSTILEEHPALAQVDIRQIEVAPLSMDEAELLANTLLPEGAAPTLARKVATESAGNPFFVCQMAEYVRDIPIPEMNGSALNPSIERVLDERIAKLPSETRRLLQLLALAGRPISRRSLLLAEPATEDDLLIAFDLRMALMAPHPEDESECLLSMYHDRIREHLVVGILSDEVPVFHLALARAFEAALDPDIQATAFHFLKSGQLTEAGRMFRLAAAQAEGALAFDKASDCLKSLLSEVPLEDPERRQLQARLADAQIRSGNGLAAARVLLELANESESFQALEYRRRAAEQLMMMGHFREGQAVIQEVFRAVRIKAPKSHWAPWILGVWKQRGTARVEEKITCVSESEVARDALLKVDGLRSVAWPLALVDLGSAFYFEAASFELATKVGERLRVVLALGSHATFIATAGGGAKERANKLLNKAQELARPLCSESVNLSLETSRALVACQTGSFRGASECFQRIVERYKKNQDYLHEDYWLYTFARSMLCRSLAESGRWAEQKEYVSEWIAEAEDVGNRYFASTLRVFWGHYCWLSCDQPDQAEAEVKLGMGVWDPTKVSIHHLVGEICLAEIELYRGNAEDAFLRMTRLAAKVGKSPLRYHQMLQCMWRPVLASAALNYAEKYPEHVKKCLRLARKQAAALGDFATTFTSCSQELILAGCAFIEGDRRLSQQFLIRARDYGIEEHRGMHVAVAQLYLSYLDADGYDPETEYSEAMSFMRSHAGSRPGAVANVLCAGFKALQISESFGSGMPSGTRSGSQHPAKDLLADPREMCG